MWVVSYSSQRSALFCGDGGESGAERKRIGHLSYCVAMRRQILRRANMFSTRWRRR